jgi:hypothetical protein
MTDLKKNLVIFIAVLPALLAGCGKGNTPAGREAPGPPVTVERIVAVEKRIDHEGAAELLIPEESVFRRGALSGVLVVGTDARIVVRWINPGRSEGGYLVVLGGLDAGERLIGRYSRQLEEGMQVQEQVSEIKEVQSHE